LFKVYGKIGNAQIVLAKSPHNNESNADMSIYRQIPKLQNGYAIIHP